MRAAETGHLVLTTLHTYNSPQAVERIIGFFSPEEQAQVRMQLSLLLMGVLSQRLLTTAEGNGMCACMEVMTSSPQIQKLIAEGKINQIHEAIASSVTHFKMQTINQSLVALCLNGDITPQEAVSTSPDADEFKRILHDFQVGRAAKID